jgi:hypothetical protein
VKEMKGETQETYERRGRVYRKKNRGWTEDHVTACGQDVFMRLRKSSIMSSL